MGKVFKVLAGLSAVLGVAALLTCPARALSVPVFVVLAAVFWYLGKRKEKKE